MTIENFKQIALAAIKENPGMTRMEWFHACCTTPDHRNTLWHTFKFEVALVLVLGGKVHSVVDPMHRGFDRFFPGSL